jgi:signal transduction histidine kinase
VAWGLAVAGPALIAVALVPFRSSLGVAGFLICTLLVVGLAAAIGGVLPALGVVVVGTLAGAFFFAPPFDDLRAHRAGDFVGLVAFAVVGSAVAFLIDQLGRLAEEQASSRQVDAALRQVATLAAGGASPEELFATVTDEVGRLLPVDFATMGRYEPDDTVTTLTGWSRERPLFPVGVRRPLEGKSLTAIVARTARPARLDSFADASGPLGDAARESGFRSGVGSPIVVDGRLWGVMIAGSVEHRLPDDAGARLASLTDLLATAIANAESRAGIARLAEEQAALRRVATLVARGAPTHELFAAVPEEVGKLLGADQTGMSRYESDGTATLVAAWARAGEPIPVGARGRLGGKNLTTAVEQTRRPSRIDRYADASGALGSLVQASSVRSGVGAPILVEGRLWGVMIVGSNEDPLPPDTEARLASFTELVATAIANAESRSDLDASRARIVAASDEARRRVERDLHDGAQQRLVSLGLALRAAQASLPPDAGAVEGELSRVADGVASVQEDLRQLARGIHPAILARGGIGPAIKALARRSPVPVELDGLVDARLPEPVEVATYYVVSEALTNAAKHARPSVVHVEVGAVDGSLRIRVRDDGAGGADPARGSGLMGLKDRVEALGGTITIQSPVGEGTSVDAELPLGG